MNQKVSRRAATAVILLPRLGMILWPMAGSALVAAAPDPKDPELLVRLTYPNPTAFREAVREKRIEVVRITAFEKPAGAVTVLALMRKSLYGVMSQDPTAGAKIVAGPPDNPTDMPKVGEGNRFAERHVLPQGQGVLRRSR